MMNRKNFLKNIVLGAAVSAFPVYGVRGQSRIKPNIIIIMTDDMGYSDVGCYGSEISTPHLDNLAENGLRFSQFYNTARCCPTRASLLTGLYPHQTGIGHMSADAGEEYPGYRGHLTKRCVTIAEALKPAGYFSMITGKWHVGAKEKDWWPLQRGFDRFFGVPEGGGFYFQVKKGRNLVLNNDVKYSVDSQLLPKGWYSTDAWTENGIKFIDEALKEKKPFFWYLAHNAPHWPLQAPPEDIVKYKGKYMDGWDQLREKRLAKMIKLGLIKKEWALTERPENVPAWESLSEEEKKLQDLGMAIYAAMMERMDKSIGNLVQALKKRNIFNNTLILFLADNGGCAEGGNMACDKVKKSPPEKWGSIDSFVKYGVSWANASNTPFQMYKHFTHEGGIATPLIAHWPNVIRDKGKITDQQGHVIDLMATCCDVGGAVYPDTYKGNKIVPLEGKSLVPVLKGQKQKGHEAIYWEHEGNRAVRKGQWKLVAKGSKGSWELYDMEADRSENKNLAEQYPEKIKQLAEMYDIYAERCMVLPKKQKKRKRKDKKKK